jgi:hypothetical protein
VRALRGVLRLLLRALAAVEEPLLTLCQCDAGGRHVAQGSWNGAERRLRVTG